MNPKGKKKLRQRQGRREQKKEAVGRLKGPAGDLLRMLAHADGKKFGCVGGGALWFSEVILQEKRRGRAGEPTWWDGFPRKPGKATASCCAVCLS